MKIKEPDYLFPIIGGIITILGLILPLGVYRSSYGTDSNFGSFFWIIFHNIEINDFITNLLINLMIPLLSILIINYTAWTFKIISDVKKKKINKKKFETEMFLLSIILFLLGIYLIMIAGNAYLIEKYDHFTSYWLPASMWGPYQPSFGFWGLIFGPIIIRFGTFYNTVETEEEKKKIITKTFIVLLLLLFFIWFYWWSYPGLDIYLAFLTIPIFVDSWIYLFPEKKKKKKPHRADMSFRIRKKIMVPKKMDVYLHQHLLEATQKNRLKKEKSKKYY